MSGIYLHIPFCKKACHYCDFHFSTSLKNRDNFILAVLQEIDNTKHFLEDKHIKTIYFGGGTPSILEVDELAIIINKLKETYKVSETVEITLEANPDDLTKTKTAELSSTGINRLSIGIQTYQEDLLKKLNRSHNKQQALDCVINAKDSGFHNLNLDIIFGLPDSTDTSFQQDLDTLIKQNPQHISAYWLTIEEKTTFGKWKKQGKFLSLPDEKALAQWSLLKIAFKKAGYIQYEISNFCKPTFESKHNGNYWKGIHYIGLGPSAHSFNGTKRSWNVSNNNKYIQALKNNTSYQTTETLSREDKVNEHIMTGIRTVWGVNLTFLRDTLDCELLNIQQAVIERHISNSEITVCKDKILLTDKGQQFADEIASNLFITT